MGNNLTNNKRFISGLISRLKSVSFHNCLSVLLVFLSLMVAALSLEQAHWVSSSMSLVQTLLMAVLACSLMIVLRLKNIVTFFLMVVVGLLVTVWKSSAVFPHAKRQLALTAWWHSVSSTLPSQNNVYFAMFLIIVTWLIGCFSVWFILKKRNAWVTVFLGAVMLLFNLSNLPNNYYYFLAIYIFLALVLVFQVNLVKQSDIVERHPDRNRFHNPVYLVLAVFLVVIMIVSVAWISPQPPLAQIAVKFDTTSMHNVDPNKQIFNIFTPIQDKWTWVESTNQEDLLFTAGLDDSDTILYVVTADKPVYLLTRRYDAYNSWGWTSNPTLTESIGTGTVVAGNEPVIPSVNLNYTVENRAKSDVILTTGQFVSADIPVTLKILTQDSIHAALGGDVMAVTSPWILGPYQHYSVVNNIPVFTTEQLNAVNGDFPDFITRNYLQLPDNFPQNVRTLSLDLVKNATTEYGKLMAVKKFLNTLQYDRKGTVPSGTEDAVALFLYATKKGNCVNFASAMVTMLRSVGVPARFCTGYLHGDLDPKTGKYIVRGKQAHAWAEVYFPGYGWIQVETTPDTSGNNNSNPSTDDTTINFSGGSGPVIPDVTSEDPLPPPVAYTPVKLHSTTWIFFTVAGVLVLGIITTRKVFDIKVGRLIKVKNPSEAYARMCYLASFTKAGPAAQETPLEYSQRLGTVISGYSDHVDNITKSYVSVRYSPRKEIIEEDEKTKLQTSWQQVCQTLIQRRLQAGKWFFIRMLWNPGQ